MTRSREQAMVSNWGKSSWFQEIKKHWETDENQEKMNEKWERERESKKPSVVKSLTEWTYSTVEILLH